MRTLSILMVVIALCAASASAELVPSGHNMMWEDYFGDSHDNYLEIERGQSFGLSIRANTSDGVWAQGGLTNVSWDPAVMSAVEDPSGTYWRQYYTLQFSASWSGGFETQWYDTWQALYEVGEGQYVNRVWVTIAPDAPYGISLMGLRQAMLGGAGDPIGFVSDAVIPRDGSDPFAMQINVIPSAPTYDPGDFDEDGDVDDVDIDTLAAFIRNSTPYDPDYDLTDDGSLVDVADMDKLIHDLVETTIGVGTEYGDFNLDGLINTTDLTILGTNYGPNGLWALGNANGYIDTVIDTTDLTILGTFFGFDATPDVIPEPITLSMLALGSVAVIRRRRK